MLSLSSASRRTQGKLRESLPLSEAKGIPVLFLPSIEAFKCGDSFRRRVLEQASRYKRRLAAASLRLSLRPNRRVSGNRNSASLQSEGQVTFAGLRASYLLARRSRRARYETGFSFRHAMRGMTDRDDQPTEVGAVLASGRDNDLFTCLTWRVMGGTRCADARPGIPVSANPDGTKDRTQQEP